MSVWEKTFTEWVNATFSDFYIVKGSMLKDGFRIVHHPAPIITQAFIRLLHNIIPETRAEVIPFSICEEYFALHLANGEQVKIMPYDDEIHHTEYVKEEYPNE